MEVRNLGEAHCLQGEKRQCLLLSGRERKGAKKIRNGQTRTVFSERRQIMESRLLEIDDHRPKFIENEGIITGDLKMHK